MKLLDVTDARKRFGATVALDGVSLSLAAGELLALLGPNGAGKTTLVRAIAGLIRLDAGGVEVLGVGRGGSPDGRLGVVPQEIAVYPLLTARENLEVFARFHGLRGSMQRDAVAWALGWTALEGRADEPVKRFSGGMKRRLNIACGVMHRPRLVLLDEPTVGVDPQSRERIYEMLAGLRREGAGLLLTTHQLEEAETRCDRVVVIDGGRVVAAGTVAELVAVTFGERQSVTVWADHLPEHLPPAFEASSGGTVRATIDDLDRDLAPLLAALRGAGAHARRLEIRAPGLAQVFLELTGRELRE